MSGNNNALRRFNSIKQSTPPQPLPASPSELSHHGGVTPLLRPSVSTEFGNNNNSSPSNIRVVPSTEDLSILSQFHQDLGIQSPSSVGASADDEHHDEEQKQTNLKRSASEESHADAMSTSRSTINLEALVDAVVDSLVEPNAQPQQHPAHQREESKIDSNLLETGTSSALEPQSTSMDSHSDSMFGIPSIHSTAIGGSLAQGDNDKESMGKAFKEDVRKNPTMRQLLTEKIKGKLTSVGKITSALSRLKKPKASQQQQQFPATDTIPSPKLTPNSAVDEEGNIAVTVTASGGTGYGTINIKSETATISYLRDHFDVQETKKRFLLVGLEYECHLYNSVDELWSSIRSSFVKRKKQIKQLQQEQQETPAPQSVQFEPIWVDIQDPSEEDMKKIQKYFHLHPLTTEDCLHGDTGEKWELFEHYMFVVFSAQVDTDIITEEDDTCQLNIIVFKNYVLTIHSKPVKGLDLVLKRIEAEFEFQIDLEDLLTSPTQEPPPVFTLDPSPQVEKQGEATTTPVSSFKKKKQNITITVPPPAILPESNVVAHKYDVKRSMNKHTARDMNLTDTLMVEDQSAIGLVSPSLFNGPKQFPASSSNDSKQAASSPAKSTVSTGEKEFTSIKRTEIPSSDWILYAFLDAMVDMHLPYVDSLVDEVERLDEYVHSLNQSERDDLLQRIGLTKKTITDMRRFFMPKHKMAAYLVSKKLKYISSFTQLYLRDVLDHITISLEKLEYVRESLNQTHANYTTKVSMEIAAAATSTDVFIGRITVFAAFISPLALISGLWGMNVKVPGQDADNLYWFFGIVGSMLIISLTMIILMRKKLIEK